MRPHGLHCTAFLALVFTSGGAYAQGFGRVANTPYDGGVTVINNITIPDTPSDKVKLGTSKAGSALTGGATSSPAVTPPVTFPPRVLSVNMMAPFKAKWREERAIVTDSVLKYLNEKNIGGGFRTSRNRLVLAEDGPLFVGTDARGFTLRFLIANNVLSTYLRTPTPVSRDADPGFTVSFDLDVSIDVDVKNNQLVASPATVRPTVRPPVGRNVTGAFAVAAADLVKTLTDQDFVGVLLSKINGQAFPLPTGLDNSLAQINPFLQKAASRGVIVVGYDEGSGNVTLTLRNAGPAPVIH